MTRERTLRDIRHVFRLEKENKAVKDITLKDIRNIFENEEENYYYKPAKVSNSWSNNYVEYKSNCDRNKTLSVKEYLNKTIPHLKDIINSLKNPGTWKIQLTIAITDFFHK